MSNGFAPITLEAFDNNGNQLFSYSVPYEWLITVESLLEQAYALNQTSSTPDPFTYTLEYFGYSEFAGFPGYLGYELTSVNGFEGNTDFFWSLSVNGTQSETGIDTTFPNPGATVTLQYQSTSSLAAHPAAHRAKAIQARRAHRAARKIAA